MHKHFAFTFTLIIGLIFPLSNMAAIYKHVDKDGRVTYSNVKIKGGKKIDLEPADSNFGTSSGESKKSYKPAKKASPEDFPKVKASEQKQRDNSRKQILLDELASEKRALEQAKKAYEEGAANPEVYRKKNADGSSSTFRNVAKYQEKMKKLQENIDVHQRNIELLEQEISNLN